MQNTSVKNTCFVPFTRPFALLGLGVCLAVGAIGCGGKQAGNKSMPGDSSRRGAAVGSGITDAEAKQFMDTMIQAMRNNDTTALAGGIDLDTLVQTSAEGLGISEEGLRGFAHGLKNSFNASTGFTAQLAASTTDGSCDLLRYVEAGGRKRARVRIGHVSNEGIKYIDFVLGRDPAGQVVAQDMYIFYSGELLSQTVRRAAVQLAADENRSILEKLHGSENDFIKHAADLTRMTQAAQTGNIAAAAQIYDSLPNGLKQEKMLKIAHIRIAEQQGDAQYMQALSEFRAAFPNDPASDLLAIDFYLLRKEYAKSLQAIDSLDKAVGGDPYLDTMRAAVYIADNKYDAACQAAEKAAQALPDHKEVLHTALLTEVLDKHYENVPRMLTALKKAGAPVTDLTTDPQYTGFVHSPQYQEWQKMDKQ